MKQLDVLDFNPDQCRKELAVFQALLAAHPALKERQDILPFFRARRHLSAFIGSREPDIIRFDRLAYEYDLFGDFACDLVLGDSVTKTYGFIELEDAAPNSIFARRGAKATPEWSPRFEHGYSQIIDGFQKIEDLERTDEFESRFGGRTIKYFGLLIVGRSESFLPRELRRLAWRQDRTVVNSKHIRCLTYDQLADVLGERLKIYPLAAQAGG